MNCYICDKKAEADGGVRYAIKIAVGICHHCGIAVCPEHGYREPEPGAPLLCASCAEFKNRPIQQKTHDKEKLQST